MTLGHSPSALLVLLIQDVVKKTTVVAQRNTVDFRFPV